jgi:tetratricopeptide (TPR) repeat protein
VLAGHGDAVTDLAFSPDGRRLATLAGGRTPRWEVKVWDAATGQEVLTLLDPEQATAVRFAADGHKLYLFSHDRRAYDASPLPPEIEAPDVADALPPAATHAEVAAQLDQLTLSPELRAKAAEVARLRPSGPTGSPLPAGSSSPVLAAVYRRDRPAEQYGRALAEAERRRAEQPNDAFAWCHYGGALYRLGRYDEALRALTHAADPSREGARVYLLSARAFLALTYHRLGQAEKAKAEWVRLRKELKAEPWPSRLARLPADVQTFFAEPEALIEPKK